jgi:glycosyltransferase involved in cell wall biosynthesis
MNKLVSVIMPVYNSARDLQATLASLAAQTYTDWELAATDDGSDDGSAEMLAAFAAAHQGRCNIFSSPRPQSGAGKCRNIALEKCNGSFVVFLDADDQLAPFCLQQRMDVMLGDPKKDLAVFQQYKWEGGDKISARLFTRPAENRRKATDAFLEMQPPWQTMAPVWKRSTLQQLRGFDESLVYMEDPDLHLRALLDNTVNVSFEYHLPVDNYYRINNMGTEKSAVFWKNSIESRILYLKKRVTEINLLTDLQLSNEYRKSLQKGFYNFLKVFGLARLEAHYNDITSLTGLLAKESVISRQEHKKLRFIYRIFRSSSPIVRLFRLKGLAYNFI